METIQKYFHNLGMNYFVYDYTDFQRTRFWKRPKYPYALWTFNGEALTWLVYSYSTQPWSKKAKQNKTNPTSTFILSIFWWRPWSGLTLVPVLYPRVLTPRQRFPVVWLGAHCPPMGKALPVCITASWVSDWASRVLALLMSSEDDNSFSAV